MESYILLSAISQSFTHIPASITSGAKLHHFLLTTLLPALKAASDATVLAGTVSTSGAIIESTWYLCWCDFHHIKISESSWSSNEIISVLRYLSKSDVLFGELFVVTFQHF